MLNIAKPIEKERVVYQGNILEFVLQDVMVGEKKMTFEWVRRTPGVRVILFDRKQKKTLLSFEHRREINGFDYRLPGGKVFNKLEEYNKFPKNQLKKKAKEAVIREALEEVGVRIKATELVNVSQCGTTVEWDLYYYISEDFELLESPEYDSGEEILRKWFTFEEVKHLCLINAINEDRSVAELLKFIIKEEK